MTLKEAVDILNRHQHRGGSDWSIPDDRVAGGESVRVVGSEIDPRNLTAFEAIAIAEKYAAGDTPRSVQRQASGELGEGWAEAPRLMLRRFGVYLLPDGAEVVAVPETDGSYLYLLGDWEMDQWSRPAYIVHPSGLIRRDEKDTGWHSKDLKDTGRILEKGSKK